MNDYTWEDGQALTESEMNFWWEEGRKTLDALEAKSDGLVATVGVEKVYRQERPDGLEQRINQIITLVRRQDPAENREWRIGQVKYIEGFVDCACWMHILDSGKADLLKEKAEKAIFSDLEGDKDE